MSDESNEIANTGTEGGLSGKHQLPQSHSVLVAPTTADEYNTLRARIAPVACWRVDDIRFEFGSSFIKPDTRDEFQELDALMKEHPGAPLSIFGHADPVGQDDFNKKLSGRRSQAVYGLLTRNTDLWEELYMHSLADDKWGVKSIQLILETAGHSPGSIDGVQGSKTTDATKAFQKEKGLTADGMAGPNTRKELFKAYMDMICVDREGKPYQLDPEKDFLAQGADTNGKGDYQGCSEFNPRLLFSQKEEAEYKKFGNREKRNAENAPNRRVIIFLFRPGSEVTPERWPCPSVKAGTADCKKRFWSDGNARRNTRLPDERREHESEKKEKGWGTFACRFYDRMSVDLPCDKVVEQICCCKRRGVVVNNLDPLQIGRVKVSIPDVYGAKIQRWAMPSVPYAGAGVGFLMIPPIGANVWIDFEGGKPELPIWSGCFWEQGDLPYADPEIKVFKTEGVTLILNDMPGVGGLTLEVGPPIVPLYLEMIFNSNGIELRNGGQTLKLTPYSVSVNDGVLEVS